VTPILQRPPGARWLYVLAHGAGAGMRHPFMNAVADALEARGVATLRWEFDYMAAGKKRIDPLAQLLGAVRGALATARELAPDLRLVAGGKSMGGRMTSNAIAAAAEPRVEGLVFLGFPLHPAKQPATARADHLREVHLPLLFIQGTRDALAEPELLRPIVSSLGTRAVLHEIEGADHGFAVPKRSGRDSSSVMAEIASVLCDWLDRLPPHVA
jgi:predicted alpha/beta-hydrolase family hydrolase